MDREHFPIIDIWISLLLCLVILGHCSVDGTTEYYDIIKTCIYSFHMAAFYFVCGFLIRHTYHHLGNINDYAGYILRKLKKFGIPFIIFGFVLCTVNVFRTPNGDWQLFGENFLKLFYDTMASPVIYLWFIYVLFEYYLIAPLICQYYKYAIFPALVIAILLLFYPLPRLFNLHQFSRYLLFLILGITSREFLSLLKKIHWLWSIIPTLAFPIAVCKIPFSVFPSILSLPALWLVSMELSKWGKIRRICRYLSRNCFGIYLWQLLFVHLLSLVILDYFHFPFGVFLFIVVPFAIVCSIECQSFFILENNDIHFNRICKKNNKR